MQRIERRPSMPTIVSANMMPLLLSCWVKLESLAELRCWTSCHCSLSMRNAFYLPYCIFPPEISSFLMYRNPTALLRSVSFFCTGSSTTTFFFNTEKCFSSCYIRKHSFYSIPPFIGWISFLDILTTKLCILRDHTWKASGKTNDYYIKLEKSLILLLLHLYAFWSFL